MISMKTIETNFDLNNILWHVNSLLGNDHETSGYTTVIAK
jgi:hypothetical protein